MDSPLPILIAVATIMCVVLLLIAGGKIERNRIYDNCMTESSQMILADARTKCKETVK